MQEGRSWMNDYIGAEGETGAQAMSPSVTIWDDGSASQGWPVPFDAEGVPRMDIITQGVVNTPVHNSYTAGKEGTVSTGHQAYFTGRPGHEPQRHNMGRRVSISRLAGAL